MNRRTLLNWLSTGLGASLGGLGFGSYAIATEAYNVQVTRRTITPKTWPAGQSLRIAALADFHANRTCMDEAAMIDIVKRTVAEKPDLIVLLGDYASQAPNPVPLKDIVTILKDLSAPMGVYGINGNHDWTDSKEAWKRGSGPTIFQTAFNGVGIPFLENEAIPLKGMDKVWLVGLESEYARNVIGYRDNGERKLKGRANRAEFLNATVLAPVPEDATVILLAHEPDIFAEELDPRIALTLSGHTHGGQIRLLGWSPFIPSRYGTRFSYGHIRERDRDLVVSSGLGSHFVAGHPLRVGSPPEIVILDVKHRQAT